MSAFRVLNTAEPGGPLLDSRGSVAVGKVERSLDLRELPTGKQYWRSLDQLVDTPKFREWVEREFPAGASELLTGASRRNVLKLMAASFGFAGLTACRRPVTHILPHAKGVEDYVHGQPLYYATAMSIGGEATGLLVEAHDGRPTKVEGNPEHPFSQGAASAWHQAAVLGLYDPDRSPTILKDGKKSSWDDFTAFAKQHFDSAKLGQGDGVRVLSQRVDSPSLAAVKQSFLQKFPNAKWIEYEPFASTAAAEGAVLAFGQAVDIHPQFDKADVIVSLDSDFLGIDSGSILPLKAFSRRRRVTSPKDELNRLYVVESQFSVTGGQADHRLRMRTGDVKQFAADLARELGVLGDGLNVVPAQTDKRRRFLVALARDMKAHPGKCLVVAGPRQPKEVHALAHAINQAFGTPGETVKFSAAEDAGAARSIHALREFAGELSRGAVNTVVVLGGNPAFDGPADLHLGANLKKAATSIYLGLENNETAETATWHIPEAHFLESWSDVAASDGTASIQQPLIEPLFGGKTQAEVVAVLSGYKDQRAYDIVRNYWLARLSGDKEKAWRKVVHDGVAANTKRSEVRPSADVKRAAALFSETGIRPENNLEVTFYPCSKVYDGRFANNAWLQETPEPMTKLTWDNAALISPATAKALNLAMGDLVSLKAGDRMVDVPVLIQPGHADGAISLHAGYGRRRCGRVGVNVGHNVYPLRTSEAMDFTTGVTLTKTQNTYALVTTQEHHTIDDGRPIVRETNLETYRDNPKVIAEMDDPHPPLLSLHREFDYTKGQQWGMAIDLTACVGCNACVLACQAENNIPVVGKEEVARGREMNWIRMDRYYAGDMEDPESIMEPVVCMQCENAPCESVCPVAATAHSPEGLNDMAYNRCVGTRYCSNNCPYKVRRFNFFNWHKDVTEVKKMVFNPDVTVRMRGVMEKCTYCVQRIQDARVRAKADGRRAIKDGEVTPACAQTCAAEAIVFGNINDPESRVSKLRAQDRNYVMLGELNTKPRTSYLAKIRNPNPELA